MYENLSTDDSVYSDEPRRKNNVVFWLRLGVYFGILQFRIHYESMSLMYEGLSLHKEVKHFE